MFKRLINKIFHIQSPSEVWHSVGKSAIEYAIYGWHCEIWDEVERLLQYPKADMRLNINSKYEQITQEYLDIQDYTELYW